MRRLVTPLESPAVEGEYRESTLAWDRRVAAALGVVAVVFMVVSIPTTFVLRDDALRFPIVLAIRCVVVGATLTAMLLVRRADTPRAFDAILTWWIGIWFVGVVAENALLPPAMTSFVSWDVFLTVAVYAAVPLSLSRQGVLAAIISLGDVIVLWSLKTPSIGFDVMDVTLAYLCANVVGVMISRELHRWRRQAFVALRSEISARADLETALREVKTLPGLIPICSFCKNIRTNAGDWEQIEAYVHAHSDAHFSHGVCPDCMRLHYPGIDP